MSCANTQRAALLEKAQTEAEADPSLLRAPAQPPEPRRCPGAARERQQCPSVLPGQAAVAAVAQRQPSAWKCLLCAAKEQSSQSLGGNTLTHDNPTHTAACSSLKRCRPQRCRAFCISVHNHLINVFNAQHRCQQLLRCHRIPHVPTLNSPLAQDGTCVSRGIFNNSSSIVHPTPARSLKGFCHRYPFLPQTHMVPVWLPALEITFVLGRETPGRRHSYRRSQPWRDAPADGGSAARGVRVLPSLGSNASFMAYIRIRGCTPSPGLSQRPLGLLRTTVLLVMPFPVAAAAFSTPKQLFWGRGKTYSGDTWPQIRFFGIHGTLRQVPLVRSLAVGEGWGFRGQEWGFRHPRALPPRHPLPGSTAGMG